MTYAIIDDAVVNKRHILIHCQAGISRSSSILIAYIMRKYRVPFLTAYNHVKTYRSIIEPNAGFRNQLLEYERMLFPPDVEMAM
jgi:protein-tyrosine phosphatase